MRTFAVANQKGGCGKTTVAINLSAALAQEGRRVLLVDMDPQGHCALGLAVPEEQIECSAADVLLQDKDGGPIEIEQAIWRISAGLDLLPSTLALARFETLAAQTANRDLYLKLALEAVWQRYDYCLVDCPPHLGLLTYNALRAADEVIIPVDTGYFSLQGVEKAVDTIRDLNSRTGQGLKIRVLANCYDVRTKLAREILTELRRKHGDYMLTAYVNFNSKLKEGASYGQPIQEYDPASAGSRDFARLAQEIMAMEPKSPVQDILLRHADHLAAGAERLLASSSVLVRPVAIDSQELDARTPHTAAATALEPRPLRGRPEQVPFDPVRTEPVEPDHERIASRVESVYGVRQTAEGIEFHTNLPGARMVLLAGDFNDWSPRRCPMARQDNNGHFAATLRLPAGRYRYRLVVDGRWQRDPCNALTEVNEFGEQNSIVEIA